MYHYDYARMTWLSSDLLQSLKAQKHILLHTEANQPFINSLERNGADAHIILSDELHADQDYVHTAPNVLSRGAIPTHSLTPETFTVNVLGFSLDDRWLSSIATNIQRDVEKAHIIIYLSNDEKDDDEHSARLQSLMARLRKVVWKHHIQITFAPLPHDEVEIFNILASASITILGDDHLSSKGEGDLNRLLQAALSLQHPLALKDGAFRKTFPALSTALTYTGYNISTLVKTSQAQIAAFRKHLQEETFITTVDTILNQSLESLRASHPATTAPVIGVSGVACYNGILDDKARELYAPIIELMFQLLPVEMQRKIPRANVQQAYVIDTVAKTASFFKNPRILCVGSYEDTAALALKALNHRIDEIDPVINYDLETFCRLPTTVLASYDIIFSTSVIEHVEDDESFMRDIQMLLAPGGYGIITCDYDDRWRPGDPMPDCDWRMYTKRDLSERFLKLLGDCELVGPAAWDCPAPDFYYPPFNYTFATMLFQRIKVTSPANRVPELALAE